MQKLNIDVTKIPKDKIFIGQKGKYISLVLRDNPNGRDQFGWDGFIVVDTTKEEREAGVKGAIVGNWKHIGQAPAKPAPAQQKPKPQPAPGQPPFDDTEEDDIPF